MSDVRRNALADKVRKYDEAKKLLAQFPATCRTAEKCQAVQDKVFRFVEEYVLILTRDGTVAPWLGVNFVEEVLTLVLGRELRAKMLDLNLHDLVRVVQEVPAKEDDK